VLSSYGSAEFNICATPPGAAVSLTFFFDDAAGRCSALRLLAAWTAAEAASIAAAPSPATLARSLFAFPGSALVSFFFLA
jgi:hypothetical protein